MKSAKTKTLFTLVFAPGFTAILRRITAPQNGANQVRYKLLNIKGKWSGRQDLNLRPPAPHIGRQTLIALCFKRFFSLISPLQKLQKLPLINQLLAISFYRVQKPAKPTLFGLFSAPLTPNQKGCAQ